jgi:hydrogenase nickel incorporation protein HypA/HybF
VHELALCGAIADIATRTAGERQVAAVHVRIGELRQVVPDTLAFCWSMVTADTELADCELDVERVAAVLHCAGCGQQHEMAGRLSFACPACGGTDVSVVAGEEFLVTAVDLGDARRPERSEV